MSMLSEGGLILAARKPKSRTSKAAGKQASERKEADAGDVVVSKSKNEVRAGSPDDGISSEERYERLLSESRLQLQNVLETIPDPAYIVGSEGDVEYANPAMVKILGPWKGRKCHEYLREYEGMCPGCEREDVFAGKTIRKEWVNERTGRTYDSVDTPLTGPEGRAAKLKIMRDVTDIREAERIVRRHSDLMEGINRILSESMECETEEELARTCLKVAERLTESPCSIMGRLNPKGRLEDITASGDYSETPDTTNEGNCGKLEQDTWVRGMLGKILHGRESILTNDPTSYPDSEDLPEVSNSLTAFLGAPLIHADKVIGIIGVANRSDGYRAGDRETLEWLAPAIVEALMRKRAETKVEWLARFPSEDPFPVLRISAEGVVLYSNRAGLGLLGQWGRSVRDTVPPEWGRLVKQILESGDQATRDVQIGTRLISLALSPVPSSEYVNVYGRDITEQKAAEAQLRKAHDELETKVRERTTALAQTVRFLEQEVDQRTQAERMLRERSRVLDAFFSHSINPLVILDRDFNFIRVNRAYAQGCQKEESEFPGHNHFEFYPHEENQAIFENVVRTKTTHEVTAKPFSFPDHPDWGVTYWDWILTPILDDEGEVEFLVFALRDVTERKRAEIAIQESEERYRALVELSPDAIVVALDERVVFANPAAVELAGVSDIRELIDRNIWDSIHSESQTVLEDALRRVLDEAETIPSLELKLFQADGELQEIEASLSCIIYQGRKAVQAVLRDITGRKRLEARRKVTSTLLELFARANSKKEYLDSVVDVIHDWTHCACAGIRLRNADGYIPYTSHVGFDHDFLALESMLCVDTDVCVCIRTITHSLEPQDAVMTTPRGSFCCGNTFRFVESLAESERQRYRGNCIKRGYASVGIVPIRYKESIVGAIHIADEAENRVTFDIVNYLEDIAILIGEAIHRFNVEDSLRLSQRRLLEAQRIAHLGNWDEDITNNRLWWSDEVYRIFGLEPHEFGTTYDAFLARVHPDDREKVVQAVDAARKEGTKYSINHRVVRPDGEIRMVHEQGQVFYDSRKQPIRMAGTVQDVTEQKHAEEALQRNREELQSLAMELQLVEERERRRLAGDLHDSIGQILAFSRRELLSMVSQSPPNIATSLKEVTTQLDKAVKQTRTLSFELSPSVLYDLGLEVALEDLAEQFSREQDIACHFRGDGEPSPMTDAIKVLLYRSVRELLINIAKHGRASCVSVVLMQANGEVRIEVQDDGIGFDTAVLEGKHNASRGFGLLSVRERLRHMGGRFEIESVLEQGTKVTLTAPLDV